jgi:hypothetical protein
MLTARTFLRSTLSLPQQRHAWESTGVRTLSSKKPVAPATAKAAVEEDVISPVTVRRAKMSKIDRNMVFGTTGKFLAPVLPENPAEISALDPADQGHRLKMDGTARVVMIRQERASNRQSPLKHEKYWRIFFYEDGMVAEKWTNSLMGWTSNGDPYQSAPPLIFPNAADAVYFAKKRGWNFVVKQPIMRDPREDGAQYQDNFLPLAVAARVQKEGVSCDQWARDHAGTSSYFRPLKYHGDGLVPQHGPNGNAPIAKHVPGYYKLR